MRNYLSEAFRQEDLLLEEIQTLQDAEDAIAIISCKIDELLKQIFKEL